MQKFVNVQTVNFRGVPSTEGNDPLTVLSLGDSIVEIGDGPPGWNHIRARVGTKEVDGFCVDGLVDARIRWTDKKQPTLRDPASPAREALVAAATEQWLLFKKGEGKENVEPFSTMIGKMWKAFGKNLTGKNTDVPWSAVAISLMVRNAAKTVAGYKSFPESIGHSRYMWESIRKAASGDMTAPFWGVPLSKARPQVGDIIGNWRNTPFSFDSFLTATENPETPCHSDIVVAVGPDLVLAIGGNIKNSVYATGYQIDTNGFLTPNRRIDADGKVVGEAIVLMTNRV
ncbi:DUF2272 domain-containing protein [Variovorax sp. GT1P44]|uniref:DUF2272 domain-containing protein n=1 Tax=Variovorax sp. GT1P44 TaxID=3443742 RepID=UPI003F469EE5